MIVLSREFNCARRLSLRALSPCISARCCGAISVLPIGWVSRRSAPPSIWWPAGRAMPDARQARPSLGHTRRRDRSIADTARNACAAWYRIPLRRLHRAGELSRQASHVQTRDMGDGDSVLNVGFGRSFAGMRASLTRGSLERPAARCSAPKIGRCCVGGPSKLSHRKTDSFSMPRSS